MYNIEIDSRDIEPCGIQIIQKLIKNGTSLVVVKKVGDSLLFGIAKQNIDIPKGKTIKIEKRNYGK
jgi:predicted Fe-Mo cluster-binding NifX family protein